MIRQDGLFCFGFTLDMNYSVERLSRWEYRKVPSDNVFETFGNRKGEVKKAYEEVYERMFLEGGDSNYWLSTILYNGGISLIADKNFAGCPAGKDLGPLITCVYGGDRTEIKTDPVIGTLGHLKESYRSDVLNIPLEYISLMAGESLEFGLPMGNHKLTDESVTFDLKIPVKVVQYLEWLNDRRSDPDAPVPYKEEVLHCRFTTPYGLR